jgi:hypothetical protein
VASAPDDDRLTLAALRTLLDGVHLATAGQLPQVVLDAARQLGWSTVLHLVDDEQRVLVPVPLPGAGSGGAVLDVEGTLAGRCFRTVEPVAWSASPATGEAAAPERGVWLPVLDGTHRLGVLRVTTAPGEALSDPVVQERCRLLAHLVGHLVVAKSAYGDGLTRVQRRRPRTVASELLQQLLPPLTFATEGVVVSGILQPAYEVAADAFDYSVVGEAAHLAVFDATGHDLAGTLLAAVALSTYRNSRREGRGLYDTAQALDEQVAEQGRLEKLVTGVLAQLDLATGRLRYLNAGHPAPLLLRRGRVVKELDGGRRILFGLGTGEADVAEEWLEPDDWVVFYTDGVTEARSPDGGFFGTGRLTDQLERSAASGLPAPETLRRVAHDVLDHQHGVLQDDATVLVVQWATGGERVMGSAATRDQDARDLAPGRGGEADVPRA